MDRLFTLVYNGSAHRSGTGAKYVNNLVLDACGHLTTVQKMFVYKCQLFLASLGSAQYITLEVEVIPKMTITIFQREVSCSTC